MALAGRMETSTKEEVALAVLAVITLITILQIWYTRIRGILSKREIIAAGIVGLVLGLALDYALGFKMGLWSYQRHLYWDVSYWTVLPAMWTEFGIGTCFLWRIIRPRWLVILLLMMPYELYGIVRDSWSYTPVWWIVVLGWIPLILTIVLLTNLLTVKPIQIRVRNLLL